MNAPIDHAGPTADTVRLQLARWVEAGWLRELDRAFAGFLQQETGDASPLLLLGAALVSHQLGRGHTCLALDAVLANSQQVLALPPPGAWRQAVDENPPPLSPADLLQGVDLPRWLQALRHPQLVDTGAGTSPMVLVGPRLYLRRFWDFEQTVRHAVDARVRPGAIAPPDTEALAQTLRVLFPSRADAPLDWQKLACALAARSAFSIITGGPGTGKTTTVVKLLAVLQTLALGADTGEADARPLRIRMAAPTGKAAARLNESISKAVQQLDLTDLPGGERVRASIPIEVVTLHRLMGSRPGTRHFRHNAYQPLPLDVLVVDEASMVDLEMMAAVFTALPVGARLVLLGDKDQLASVEAGAVLGELCRRADKGHYLAETRDWLAQIAGERLDDSLVDANGHPLDQAVAKLRHSYRFSQDSGIGQLASAVNGGDKTTVRNVLSHGYADLARLDLAATPVAFDTLVLDGAATAFANDGCGRELHGQQLEPPTGYRHYLTLLRSSRPVHDAAQDALDGWARAVLEAFNRFQLLCAVREGPQGVVQMNRHVARLLQAQGLVTTIDGWYLGRPVMVTRNDHALGLMNGDVGITLALPHPDGLAAATPWMLRVAFPAEDGAGIRWVLPSRLQSVETAFAMTVHKSQGSEFVHGALLLPERTSPVLTRELIYTGITRARHWFTLATSDQGGQVLPDAVSRRVERATGLME